MPRVGPGELGARVRLTSGHATLHGFHKRQHKRSNHCREGVSRHDRRAGVTSLTRRAALGSIATSVLMAGLGHGAEAAIGGEDEIARWTPDYVNKIAGTIEVDTAAECAKVVPLKTKGRL